MVAALQPDQPYRQYWAAWCRSASSRLELVRAGSPNYGPSGRRRRPIQARGPNSGWPVRSVKAWEAGATLPRLFYRRRLAKAFGVGIAELGFRSPDPSER